MGSREYTEVGHAQGRRLIDKAVQPVPGAMLHHPLHLAKGGQRQGHKQQCRNAVTQIGQALHAVQEPEPIPLLL